MGFATHLGPWLLGTVKNTTGTTAGTVRNTGCTVVAQSGVTTVADTTATTEFWIPAGSQILAIYVDITSAYGGSTGNTITVKAGTTTLGQVGNATTTPLNTGRATFAISAASIDDWINTGTADLPITVTYACAGTASGGAATVTCQYVVRNSNGGQFQPANQI
jgi:hypothetical protein